MHCGGASACRPGGAIQETTTCCGVFSAVRGVVHCGTDHLFSNQGVGGSTTRRRAGLDAAAQGAAAVRSEAEDERRSREQSVRAHFQDQELRRQNARLNSPNVAKT